MNTTIFNKMINEYNRLSYTHNYIFGFIDNGTVYAVITTAKVLPYVLTLDKASRGCGYSIRFSPTKAQKEYLKTFKLIPICSDNYFNAVVSESKYNKGEIFEKMVTEMFNQEWKKDNVPFTVDGDITVDGTAFQIKFQKATFANEKQLKRLA